MDVHGCRWISMDIHRYPWISMDGYPWISMDIHGYPWISTDIHGYPWISMDIHGYPWISMDIHGYPWISMLFADGARNHENVWPSPAKTSFLRVEGANSAPFGHIWEARASFGTHDCQFHKLIGQISRQKCVTCVD